jgi:hypothetical protein
MGVFFVLAFWRMLKRSIPYLLALTGSCFVARRDFLLEIHNYFTSRVLEICMWPWCAYDPGLRLWHRFSLTTTSGLYMFRANSTVQSHVTCRALGCCMAYVTVEAYRQGSQTIVIRNLDAHKPYGRFGT